jgi:hypothetical protein
LHKFNRFQKDSFFYYIGRIFVYALLLWEYNCCSAVRPGFEKSVGILYVLVSLPCTSVIGSVFSVPQLYITKRHRPAARGACSHSFTHHDVPHLLALTAKQKWNEVAGRGESKLLLDWWIKYRVRLSYYNRTDAYHIELKYFSCIHGCNSYIHMEMKVCLLIYRECMNQTPKQLVYSYI